MARLNRALKKSGLREIGKGTTFSRAVNSLKMDPRFSA
jgi:hypothetical protein